MKTKSKLFVNLPSSVLPLHQSSASSSSPALSGLVQGQTAVSGPKEQLELNRQWKEKSESQSRSRVCDSEAFDDSRYVHYILHRQAHVLYTQAELAELNHIIFKSFSV